jgi:hypothetical protein
MTKSCRQCAQQFEITAEDLAFYDEVSPVFAGKKYPLPPPTLCPDCRQQRRLMPVNDINLFRRKCDATDREIVSTYHPKSPYKVYDQEYWWGDKWDAMDYGKDFDFSRPFFDQFNELLLAVPRPNVFTGYQDDINCSYTNGAGKNKNCYLIFDADYCQDTYYSYSVNHTINCIDCHRARQCELCYEAVDSKNCYNCLYIKDCSNCSDGAFLENCQGCKHCFMCVNLQQKEYCVRNRQVTKEEYEKSMAALSSRKNVEKLRAEFEQFKLRYPVKYMHSTQCENVSGDHLYNCKNVHQSFDVNDARDCKRLYQMFCSDIKDTADCNECGEFVELAYECSTCGYNLNRALFSYYVIYQSSDVMYCAHCHYGNNLFGCVGLKRKKFCILNKQYSKEEYEKIVPKIIEHMIGTGEWGEFMPGKIASYPYNESLVMDYYPLSKEQALAKGYGWRDAEQKTVTQTYISPDNVGQTDDSVLKEILQCTGCSANFKIIPQELAFYRQKNIPLPTQCFKCRYQRRLKSRNPRKLWDRKCAKCGTGIMTSYAPDRPEKVYCESCYLKEVY